MTLCRWYGTILGESDGGASAMQVVCVAAHIVRLLLQCTGSHANCTSHQILHPVTGSAVRNAVLPVA